MIDNCKGLEFFLSGGGEWGGIIIIHCRTKMVLHSGLLLQCDLKRQEMAPEFLQFSTHLMYRIPRSYGISVTTLEEVLSWKLLKWHRCETDFTYADAGFTNSCWSMTWMKVVSCGFPKFREHRLQRCYHSRYSPANPSRSSWKWHRATCPGAPVTLFAWFISCFTHQSVWDQKNQNNMKCSHKNTHISYIIFHISYFIYHISYIMYHI